MNRLSAQSPGASSFGFGLPEDSTTGVALCTASDSTAASASCAGPRPQTSGSSRAEVAAACQQPGSERTPSSVQKSRWFAHAVHGDLRCLTLEEVLEVCAIFGGPGATQIDLAEIRNATLPKCTSPVVSRNIEELLNTAEAEGGNPVVDAEHFLQAMRLGSSMHAAALTSRMRGIDWSFDVASGRRHSKHVRRHRAICGSCRSLLFSFVFFTLFCLLVIGHFRQDIVYDLLSAVEADIPVDDLKDNYPGALWAWLESPSRKGSSRVSRFNEVVAGISISKLSARSRGTLCRFSLLDYIGNGFRTQVKFCRTAQERQMDDSHQVWLHWSLKDNETDDLLKQVKNWWTRSSSRPARSDITQNPVIVPEIGPEYTRVSVLAYNPTSAYYVLYGLTFGVSQSGAVGVAKTATAFNSRPAWIDPSSDIVSNVNIAFLMVGDVTFVLMFVILLLIVSIETSTKIKTSVFKQEKKRTIWDFIHWVIWDFMDWVTICMTLALLCLYPYQVGLTSDFLRCLGGLPTLSETEKYSMGEFEAVIQNSGKIGWYEYLLRLDAVSDQAGFVIKAHKDTMWYASVLAACICFRFFQAFRFNPRLYMLVKTMRKASGELSHFMIIFVVIFCGFVVVAHSVFGGDMEEFSSIPTAMRITFMMMMGYHYSHVIDAMYGGAGYLRVLWSGAFNFIIILLFLEMVLAVVLDAYSCEKKKAGKTPTLFDQARQLLQEQTWFTSRLPSRLSLTVRNQEDNGQILVEASTSSSGNQNQNNGSTALPDNQNHDGVNAAGLEGNSLAGQSADGHSAGLERNSADGHSAATGNSSHMDSLFVNHCRPGTSTNKGIQSFLQRVAEEDAALQPKLSLSESMRLCRRADAALRELTPVVRELKRSTQQREADRTDILLAVARVARAAGLPKPEGNRRTTSKASIHPNRSARASDATVLPGAGCPPRGHNSEEAENDNNCGSIWGITAVQEMYQVTKVANSERYKHERLEDLVQSLGRWLEPLLQGTAAPGRIDSTQDNIQKRMQKIEENLESLSAVLSPLLDIGSSPGHSPNPLGTGRNQDLPTYPDNVAWDTPPEFLRGELGPETGRPAYSNDNFKVGQDIPVIARNVEKGMIVNQNVNVPPVPPAGPTFAQPPKSGWGVSAIAAPGNAASGLATAAISAPNTAVSAMVSAATIIPATAGSFVSSVAGTASGWGTSITAPRSQGLQGNQKPTAIDAWTNVVAAPVAQGVSSIRQGLRTAGAVNTGVRVRVGWD